MEGKWAYGCEYAKQSLLLYYSLLIIILFSVWPTVNLLLPHPVFQQHLFFSIYNLWVMLVWTPNNTWGLKMLLKFQSIVPEKWWRPEGWFCCFCGSVFFLFFSFCSVRIAEEPQFIAAKHERIMMSFRMLNCFLFGVNLNRKFFSKMGYHYKNKTREADKKI